MTLSSFPLWRSLRGRVLLVITASLLTLTIILVASFLLLSNKITDTWINLYFNIISERASLQIADTLDRAKGYAEFGAASPSSSDPIQGDAIRHELVQTIRQVLAHNESLFSMFVGHDDGSFLQIIRIPPEGTLPLGYPIPEGTFGVLRVLPAGQKGANLWEISFLARDGRVLGHLQTDKPAYDPRQRDWFRLAKQTGAAVLSPPYQFASTPVLGTSASHVLDDGKGVFAVDLTLSTLRKALSSARVSPHGALVMLTPDERIMAASSGIEGVWNGPIDALPTLRTATNPLLRAIALVKDWGSFGRPLPVSVQGTDYLVWISPPQGMGSIAIVAPISDFRELTRDILFVIGTLALLVLIVVNAIALSTIRPALNFLNTLTEDAERVAEMDFTGELPEKTPVHELDALTNTLRMMKQTLLRRTRSLAESHTRLLRLVDVGAAMAQERDYGTLLASILQEAKTMTAAEAGVLYVSDEDGNLRTEIVFNDVTQVRLFGNHHDQSTDLPILPTLLADGSPNMADPVTAAYHGKTVLHLPDLGQPSPHDLEPYRQLHPWFGAKPRSMLVVPLVTADQQVAGVVQLVNARQSDQPGFSPSARMLVRSLAGQAAAALQNRTLLDAQTLLMDSIVRLLAGAIDAKSPYTGDHASRVPEIAECIANALCQQRNDIRSRWFNTPEQWRTFHMASWLHDCGKVTSPEFVMDKATKLETVHNRIHEIRTRFEVLLRDAEIARLKGEMDDAEYAARAERLQQDFTFLAQCNLGAESLSAEQAQRIRTIAQQTWLRHFDDRLGLAHEEALRANAQPAMPLPAVEHLLADKPEHRIAWDARELERQDDSRFTVHRPDVMYDRGEIYNLCISRGTLTAEERFKIIDHAIQTIVILENLPLPKDLKMVPLFAGSHHETLNGTGYPRGLKAEDLPPPSRILAIADIFDALVAPDRPYKKAKKLSEAIAILASIRDRGEIDAEIFNIFLTSGAMLRYAEERLPPSQIDYVDIDRYSLMAAKN